MPTYQYKCTLCEYEFEEFQSMKEEALIRCPECGQNGLKRLIGTGAGMIFKGSGFYLTDYKGGTAKKETSTDKKSETKKTDSSTHKATTSETKSNKPSSDANNKATQ